MQDLPPFNNAKYSHLIGLRLFLAVDLRAIAEYRRVAQDFLQRHLAITRETEDLVLVIDEALTNVIRHSCGGRPHHSLQLQLLIETEQDSLQRRLTIIVVDRGEAGRTYSPAERLAENLARIAAGETSGFGLVLMHRLMDHVDYRVTPEGENRLVLHKALGDGAPSDSYVARLIHDLHDAGALASA